jgi:hypothetical protein
MVGGSRFPTASDITKSIVCITLFLLNGCAQEYDGYFDRFETCLESIDLEHNELNTYPILLSRGLFPTFICNFGDHTTYCVHMERTSEGKCLRKYSYTYEKKRSKKPT